MTALAARFDHAFAPGSSLEAARTLAEILSRPCFVDLRRVSAMRGDRQADFEPKSAETVSRYLVNARNDSVILDGGRGGRIAAKARLDTGLTARGDNPARPAPLVSYVIVPLTNADIPGLVDALCGVAVALRAVSGAITAERTFGRAQNFALSVKSDHSEELAAGETTEGRLKERAAHYFYSMGVADRVAAPEWGLFLSEGHLSAVPAEELRRSGAFSAVRVLTESPPLAHLQLTDDPEDALTEGFEGKLGAARRALRPLLMDAANLPDYAWK